jgi:phosphatidylserine/phosphatidylglycerophosphate/cardiolipin synthase-like enzyme
VTESVADVAVRLAQTLPAADLDALATAAMTGRPGVIELRARTASAILRAACDDLLAIVSEPPGYLAGVLAGASAATAGIRRNQAIDVVWTGPESDVDTARLTSAVIVELVNQAAVELLLVSYATHSEPRVTAAISQAAARGVEVTVLLERSADNPNYSGHADPFRGLPIRRLAWLPSDRPLGAALHAKLIIVDCKTALVGSANITGRAMNTNLECGMLIRGGGLPKLIRDHLFGLVRKGCLRRISDNA